jgi:hypothetical protein
VETFLDRLGRLGRLIRFDKRGTGMSDRPGDVPDLETRVHDVLSVMDVAGSGRAVLFGYSEGRRTLTDEARISSPAMTSIVTDRLCGSNPTTTRRCFELRKPLLSLSRPSIDARPSQARREPHDQRRQPM